MCVDCTFVTHHPLTIDGSFLDSNPITSLATSSFPSGPNVTASTFTSAVLVTGDAQLTRIAAAAMLAARAPVGRFFSSHTYLTLSL